MRLPADAVLLIIDAQEAVDGPRHGAGDGLGGRDRTSPPSSPRGGLRGCRWPTSPGNRAALPTRRSTARSSSSATRRAPLSAPTSKPDSTNSARRPWCYAARWRPMRSKHPHGTQPTSAIRCLSSPTRAGRSTRPISEDGSGRLRTCGRWRWPVSKARRRPSSTPRRRSGPPRRPRRASGAVRQGPDAAIKLYILRELWRSFGFSWSIAVSAAKTPDSGGWISLDFLGFSRPKRVFSIGYDGFSSKIFSPRFSPSRTP